MLGMKDLTVISHVLKYFNGVKFLHFVHIKKRKKTKTIEILGSGLIGFTTSLNTGNVSGL